MHSDTIVAQCTPSGIGALALIRISGPKALSHIGKKISKISSSECITTIKTHTISHGYIIDEYNNIIDEVMFFIMQAPRTFTGENTLEISCHNNPFIIENIINCAIKAGARLAQPGEFSRQAVENGKINIMQSEAIKELIHAQTQEALKISLQQIKGSLSAEIQTLEKPLIKAIALCEASFEFLEEEMSFYDQICQLLQETQKNINRLLLSFDQQKQIREGIRIALVGSVNAGKSSLFNALIGKNRAIVTNIAGTTRDSIEYGIYQDGKYLTFIDTAGLRITDDIIEQEGIERSYEEAKKADLILLIIDGSNQNLNEKELEIYTKIIKSYPEKYLIVFNKLDCISTKKVPSIFKDFNIIYTSAIINQNLDILKQEINHKMNILLEKNKSPFLLNKRHYNLLLACKEELLKAENILYTKSEYELISLHIQKGLSLLCELTGKSISQNAMDSIFRDFCVGK